MVSTHVLKTNSGTPSRGSLTFMWLCHTFVSFNVNIFMYFVHVCYMFKCLSIFTFSINPLGKINAKFLLSHDGFALWMMR